MAGSKADVAPHQITFTEGGFCNRRSKMEKCLFFFVILFFLIAVAAIAVAVHLHLDEDEAREEVCTSHDCLETAAFISKSLDTTVNPCDDFYQFACGRWMKDNPIPSSLPSINHFAVLGIDLQKTMRDLLSENDPNALDGIAKARAFFKSCENTDAMEAKGTGPLLDMLKSAGRNLFPTLERYWVDRHLNLNQMLMKVGKVGGLGLSPLIIVRLAQDKKQPDKYVISLPQAGLILPSRQAYLMQRNNTLLMKYEKLYVDIMTSLGAHVNTARRDAVDLVDFEILLANATEPPEDKDDALYHNMTVRTLTDRYPKFDWLGHLQRQFAPVDIDISMEEELVLDGMTYYDNIFPVIDSTARRTLMNYCMWQIIYNLVGYLDKRMRDLKTDFLKTLTGVTRSPERWKVCVASTKTFFPDAYGRLYVDKKFSHVTKERVESMIQDLTASFKEIVQEADWMSNDTKRAAMEKANEMTYKIGYPEEIMNDTALNHKTENYTITSDGYFHNSLDITRQSTDKTLRLLRKPVDRKKWPISAATVGAIHQFQANTIVFPAGILHRPFFSDQYSDALNYGGIGFVIGHEITHGVDDTGRAFDKYGHLKSWWQPDDLKRFVDRYQCMVEQYGNYKDPVLNMNVNGKLTVGENIADNGGLKEAFRAYRMLITSRGKEEPKLSTLDFTPNQLFFISAAQVWCENKGPEKRLQDLRTDEHSPNRWRVVGPMQNSEDFSRAFNCPVGSYMNPEKKCRVW